MLLNYLYIAVVDWLCLVRHAHLQFAKKCELLQCQYTESLEEKKCYDL